MRKEGDRGGGGQEEEGRGICGGRKEISRGDREKVGILGVVELRLMVIHEKGKREKWRDYSLSE